MSTVPDDSASGKKRDDSNAPEERDIFICCSDDEESTQVLFTLAPTGEGDLTNLHMGIDAMDVSLTHITPESLEELGHFIAEWAERIRARRTP